MHKEDKTDKAMRGQDKIIGLFASIEDRGAYECVITYPSELRRRYQHSHIPQEVVEALEGEGYEVEMGVSPCGLSYEIEDKLGGIMNCKASISLLSKEDGVFQHLYSSKGRDIRLTIFRTSRPIGSGDGFRPAITPIKRVIWVGTLDPETYEEPYIRENNYLVNLTFSDFSPLKRVEHSFKGLKSIQHIVRACINQMTFPTLTTSQNWRPSYAQYRWYGSEFMVDTALFGQDDKKMSLYEILNGILRAFNLTLVLREGQFVIANPISLSEQAGTLPNHELVVRGDDGMLLTDRLYKGINLEIKQRLEETIAKVKHPTLSEGSAFVEFHLAQNKYLPSHKLRFAPRFPESNEFIMDCTIEPINKGEEQNFIALYIDFRQSLGLLSYNNFDFGGGAKRPDLQPEQYEGLKPIIWQEVKDNMIKIGAYPLESREQEIDRLYDKVLVNGRVVWRPKKRGRANTNNSYRYRSGVRSQGRDNQIANGWDNMQGYIVNKDLHKETSSLTAGYLAGVQKIEALPSAYYLKKDLMALFTCGDPQVDPQTANPYDPSLIFPAFERYKLRVQGTPSIAVLSQSIQVNSDSLISISLKLFIALGHNFAEALVPQRLRGLEPDQPVRGSIISDDERFILKGIEGRTGKENNGDEGDWAESVKKRWACRQVLVKFDAFAYSDDGQRRLVLRSDKKYQANGSLPDVEQINVGYYWTEEVAEDWWKYPEIPYGVKSFNYNTWVSPEPCNIRYRERASEERMKEAPSKLDCLLDNVGLLIPPPPKGFSSVRFAVYNSVEMRLNNQNMRQALREGAVAPNAILLKDFEIRQVDKRMFKGDDLNFEATFSEDSEEVYEEEMLLSTDSRLSPVSPTLLRDSTGQPVYSLDDPKGNAGRTLEEMRREQIRKAYGKRTRIIKGTFEYIKNSEFLGLRYVALRYARQREEVDLRMNSSRMKLYELPEVFRVVDKPDFNI